MFISFYIPSVLYAADLCDKFELPLPAKGDFSGGVYIEGFYALNFLTESVEINKILANANINRVILDYNSENIGSEENLFGCSVNEHNYVVVSKANKKPLIVNGVYKHNNYEYEYSCAESDVDFSIGVYYDYGHEEISKTIPSTVHRGRNVWLVNVYYYEGTKYKRSIVHRDNIVFFENLGIEKLGAEIDMCPNRKVIDILNILFNSN